MTISVIISPFSIPGTDPCTPLEVWPGTKDDAFVIVSQYVILPLFGATTTRPGSPPAVLAAKAAIGSGSVEAVDGNGNLKEKTSRGAGEEDEEL